MSGLEAPLREAAAACVHAYRVGSHAVLWFVRADNLAKETVAVNMPGTGKEHPNRRQAPPAFAKIVPRLDRSLRFFEEVRREREKF